MTCLYYSKPVEHMSSESKKKKPQHQARLSTPEDVICCLTPREPTLELSSKKKIICPRPWFHPKLWTIHVFGQNLMFLFSHPNNDFAAIIELMELKNIEQLYLYDFPKSQNQENPEKNLGQDFCGPLLWTVSSILQDCIIGTTIQAYILHKGQLGLKANMLESIHEWP